ncbi:DPP IV N-terminal domain-containing protein [bacterium]|nr:DPP IV N-terminal domain-containing protein [bacterium]
MSKEAKTRFPGTAAAVLALIWAVSVSGQGTREDYRRARHLKEEAETLYRTAAESPQWVNNTHRLWYRRHTSAGKEFMLVDADDGTKRRAFDHPLLAAALSEAMGEKVDPYNLPFSRITFIDDMKQIEFTVKGGTWRCDLGSYTCTRLRSGEKENGRDEEPDEDQAERNYVESPDGLWQAYVHGFNVFIRSADGKETHQLSFDGNEGYYYEVRFLWSPDSKKLLTRTCRLGSDRQVHYIDSAPDNQLQPIHFSRTYYKPGDVIPVRKPALFSITEKRQIPLSDSLYRDPYYIRNLAWRHDSRTCTFEYNQRGHQVYRVLEVDAETGGVRALVDEASETFFCYYGKLYRYHLNGGDELIWMSERDGWNHLYLYDCQTASVKNQITSGEWVVRSVLFVDERRREIIFTAGGMVAGEDPYHLHCCRINFDGTGLTRLTGGNATHEVVFSDDHRYFVDTASRVDLPPITVLRSARDGGDVMTLEYGDAERLLQSGWRLPEVFAAKGRDGTTDIWGIIIRPSTFDASRTYPVIEYIYAGPHNSFVPKSFSPWFSMQSLAELGCIVVQIDGMGTSNRSKAFHDVCYKNLKDAGFPDRIAWHRAVAERYAWYDISRGVGIYGHSAGGQNAAGALLFHPDVYTVAVASCGCHDNRMDKISWNEQWMGYPVGPHYAESSNVENARLLRGKLFLIVGELDTNVDPASTMQVVDALVSAGKDFDLLVLPGAGHSYGGEYGERRRMDFFVEHLMGVTPPDWNSEDGGQ